MRLQSFLAALWLGLSLPSLGGAAAPAATPVPAANASSAPTSTVGIFDEKEKGTFNEAQVDKIDGTVMVQHQDGSKPTALQTGSTLQKGDSLLVYDQSWVILKTHRGDLIGFDENTQASLDEYYFKGPDRQVRLVLKKGTLLLRTNGDSSRQSFFEINVGSLLVDINNVEAVLTYDPAKDHLRADYYDGDLKVIDKDAEQKFTVEHSAHNWVNGKMMEAEPEMSEEMDVENYRRFMEGEPRLVPGERNILLKGGY